MRSAARDRARSDRRRDALPLAAQQLSFTEMIDHASALALLRSYGLKEKRIEHSIGVAEFAQKLAERIASRHPELEIDPAKVSIAGLLHDIGRSRDGDHELNSIDILRAEGLSEIAAMVMHGTLYEMGIMRGEENPDHLPHSIENKIVAYADARFRLEVISLKERIDDIKARYADNPVKVKAVETARLRFLEMEKELMELAG